MQRVSLIPTLLALSLLTSGCLLNVDTDAEQEFADAVNGVNEDMSSGEGDMPPQTDMGEDMDVIDDMPAGMTCDDVDEAEFCNGHGICEEEEDGLACSCEGEYSGKQCEFCNEGFMRDGDGECVAAQPCDDLDCNDRGTCILVNGTDPECACDEGYAGSSCTICDAANGYTQGPGDELVCITGCVSEDEPCSGHGTCDDASGEIVCACDEGYDGDRCDACAAGYVDNNSDGVCVDNCGGIAVSECGPNSMCDVNNDDVLECTCEEGYRKDPMNNFCIACEDGYQRFGMTGMCVPLCEEANLNCPSPEVCFDPPGERARCEFFPSTCAELAGTLGQARRLDDFYELYLENDPARPWVAYCKDMTSTPLTYLPLANTSGRSNAFTRVQNAGGPGLGVPQLTTRYRMLRIEPNHSPNPIVYLDDTAFAETIYFDKFDLDPSPSQMSGDFMWFGTVETNADNNTPDPNFRVTSTISAATLDLRNTSFKPLAPTFVAYDVISYCFPQAANTGSVMMFSSGEAFAIEVSNTSNLGPSAIQTREGLRCSEPMNTPDVVETPGAPLVMEVVYSGAATGSALTHPASCEEVRAEAERQGMMPIDGDYTVYVGWDPAKPWTAYCEGMNTPQPKTYVTLPPMGFGSNEFELVRGYAPNTIIETILYEKIEIDPYTLEVNISNKTHTQITPQTLPTSEYPDYGTLEVRDDFNNGAEGRVSLQGTNFKLAPSPLNLTSGAGFGSLFGPQTCDAIVNETFSMNNRVADLTLAVDPTTFDPMTPAKASPNRRALFQGMPSATPCYDTRPFMNRSSEEDYVLRLEYVP